MMRQRGVAVVLREGRVLLVRDKGRSHYSLPGGGIKRGEPTISAAARELFEEVGLTATKIMRLRYCDYKGTVNHHKVCIIEAEGEPHLKGDELDKFIWWDMKEPVQCYPHVTNILSNLLKS